MSWTLLEHGDGFERQHWPLLKDTWPNYEVLWGEFIVPLTGRPQHIGLREGTDTLLEEMCMAHYSIFRHLVRAHLLFPSLQRAGDPARTEDEVFFHMGASTEMVDRFLVVLWKIHQMVEAAAPPEPLSRDELLERVSQFYDTRYAKAHHGYLDTGRSVGLQLHHMRELGRLLVSVAGAEDPANDVWRIADDIRSYRNFLTHNPLVPKLIDKNAVVLLPKLPKLREYDLWSSAFLSETASSDYVPAYKIVRHNLETFESRLNQLWTPIIELLKGMSATDAYAEMLPALPEGPTVTVPDSPPTTPPGDSSSVMTGILPSGTASAYEETPDLATEDQGPEPGE